MATQTLQSSVVPNRLEGKVAIITGGDQGIGRAIALRFAAEGADTFGITVNNIAPGAIETPINKALLNDPAKLKPLLENIPLKRLGTPEDDGRLYERQNSLGNR